MIVQPPAPRSRFHGLAAATLGVLLACSPSDFDESMERDPSSACAGGGRADEGSCSAAGDESDASRLDAGETAAEASLAQPEHDGAPMDEDATCSFCTPDADDEGGANQQDGSERRDGNTLGDAESYRDEDAAAADARTSSCPLGDVLCDPGEFGMEARGCGACGAGMQLRTRRCAGDGCGWGEWSAWSACAGNTSECTTGEAQRQMQSCGSCNQGTQTRTRSCMAATCSWGAWSAWSECSAVVSECVPSQMETQTEPCGACNTGKRTRIRSCSSASCTWGGWGAWSACSGVTAACTPGDTIACSPADSCGHRVCSASCTWGGCVPRVANGCLRRRNGAQEEGSNYRCCRDGAWQFCMPSCQWSADCAACSPDFCEC